VDARRAAREEPPALVGGPLDADRDDRVIVVLRLIQEVAQRTESSLRVSGKPPADPRSA